MRIVDVICRDGTREPVPVYTLDDFPWEKVHTGHYIKHRFSKTIKGYCTTFATFDIETTTLIPDRDDKGNFITSPEGYMYIWQMCIDGICLYGRYWSEFIEALNRIQERCNNSSEWRFVIYVHNLGYEFQFIHDYLDKYCGGFDFFASQPRKPMKVSSGNGFEFRCSYKLTNMSLQKFLLNEKGVIHIKAAEDLDYKLIRTPNTELTDTEFGYCISDVLGLYEGIVCKLANEGDNLDTIPLTSTGYVRRDCRRASRKEERYHDFFKTLIMTETTFSLLDQAKRGGNTHANRLLSGRLMYDVDSYDFQSAYPAMLLLRDYPCTAFTPYGYVESMEELNDLLDKYACLFTVMFEDLEVRNSVAMPYLPFSKLLGTEKTPERPVINDNGRVLSCWRCAITMTEIDFKIMLREYTWSSISVGMVYKARKAPLPEFLRKTIMDYFIAKTELKALKSKQTGAEKENTEYLYAKSKNRLNGIFGMCLTSPIHPEITMNDDGSWSQALPDIATALAKYQNSRNSFLYYAWGVWCTAYAREHLERMLTIAGADAIYCDTDSVKAVNLSHEAMDDFNAEVMRQCEERGAYCDVEGKRYYLGMAELETEVPYTNFKTYGAKKYAYTEGDDFHITIAGVAKKEGAAEMGSIDAFKLGYTFHAAGGQTLYYNKATIHDITVNGCTFSTASNIGMVDSSYQIGVTEEYFDLIANNILDMDGEF